MTAHTMIAHTRRLRRAGVVLLLVSVAGAGCSRKAAEATEDQPVVRVQSATDSAAVSVGHPELYPLVTVARRELADELVATGVVGPDVNRTVPVTALGGGRVVALRAKLGDDVRKGQPLVVISSPDAAAAVADYQKFTADATLARKQLERARVLFEHGSIAKKDLEAAEDADQKAMVDRQTAAERVRMLGGDLQRPSPFIELLAPISGTIIEQNVTAASGVKSPDNSPNLFTIADLSHVWILCDVYENDLGRVHLGSLARVRLKAYPDRVFTGTVGDIAKVLDPATRTARVRVELTNPGGVMRQGMFASVTLVSERPQSRLVVPATAILRLHDADWVFVKTNVRAFRRTKVVAGTATADGRQVVSGPIAEGDQVVVNALQFSRATVQ